MVVKAPDDLPAVKRVGDLKLVALDLVPVVFFNRLKGVVCVDQLNRHVVRDVQPVFDGLHLDSTVAVNKADVVFLGPVVPVRHHVDVVRLGRVQTNTGRSHNIQGQLLHVDVAPGDGQVIFFVVSPLLRLGQGLVHGNEIVLREAPLEVGQRHLANTS